MTDGFIFRQESLTGEACCCPFDQKMKNLGIRIVRYADDILIFAPTKRKAEQYQRIASGLLETLKLTVNTEKTHICNVSQGVKYLGFVIRMNYVSIDKERLKRFKDKIRSLTPRNSGISTARMIERLTPILRGWGQYFRV